MESNPLVSVIIPTYNNALYLAEAIDSVLAQDYAPLEIILVDDGSTDDTASIAQRYGALVRYVFQENSGTSIARNNGTKLANGKLFAFLDADDLWLSSKISQQVSILQKFPDTEAVFGQVQQFYSPDLTESERATIKCSDQPIPGYLPSAMLIRQKAFFRVGLFAPDLFISECVDWYARFREVKIRSHILPNLVTRRRLHRNNKARQNTKYNAELMQLLRDSLVRRNLSQF